MHFVILLVSLWKACTFSTFQLLTHWFPIRFRTGVIFSSVWWWFFGTPENSHYSQYFRIGWFRVLCLGGIIDFSFCICAFGCKCNDFRSRIGNYWFYIIQYIIYSWIYKQVSCRGNGKSFSQWAFAVFLLVTSTLDCLASLGKFHNKILHLRIGVNSMIYIWFIEKL